MNRIESLQPQDWATALHLAHAQAPEEDRAARVVHGLNLLADGTLDPSMIRIARAANGALIGVQVCVPLAGASCLFWPPTAEGEVADRLLAACLDECRRRGVKLAQAFVMTADLPRAQPLVRQGFQHITRMYHLRHALTELPPLRSSSLRYETFRTVPPQQFIRVLQRTYEETLDCPELNDKRTTEEIIAGHQAEGKFDPECWWLAYEGSEAVGVLMLAELPEHLSWDLAYLGIVPEQRQHGYGRLLLQHALQFMRAQPTTQMLLAVDARNLPARRLYESAGFVEKETYEVFLQFLQ